MDAGTPATGSGRKLSKAELSRMIETALNEPGAEAVKSEADADVVMAEATGTLPERPAQQPLPAVGGLLQGARAVGQAPAPGLPLLPPSASNALHAHLLASDATRHLLAGGLLGMVAAASPTSLRAPSQQQMQQQQQQQHRLLAGLFANAAAASAPPTQQITTAAAGGGTTSSTIKAKQAAAVQGAFATGSPAAPAHTITTAAGLPPAPSSGAPRPMLGHVAADPVAMQRMQALRQMDSLQATANARAATMLQNMAAAAAASASSPQPGALASPPKGTGQLPIPAPGAVQASPPAGPAVAAAAGMAVGALQSASGTVGVPPARPNNMVTTAAPPPNGLPSGLPAPAAQQAAAAPPPLQQANDQPSASVPPASAPAAAAPAVATSLAQQGAQELARKLLQGNPILANQMSMLQQMSLNPYLNALGITGLPGLPGLSQQQMAAAQQQSGGLTSPPMQAQQQQLGMALGGSGQQVNAGTALLLQMAAAAAQQNAAAQMQHQLKNAQLLVANVTAAAQQQQAAAAQRDAVLQGALSRAGLYDPGAAANLLAANPALAKLVQAHKQAEAAVPSYTSPKSLPRGNRKVLTGPRGPTHRLQQVQEVNQAQPSGSGAARQSGRNQQVAAPALNGGVPALPFRSAGDTPMADANATGANKRAGGGDAQQAGGSKKARGAIGIPTGPAAGQPQVPHRNRRKGAPMRAAD